VDVNLVKGGKGAFEVSRDGKLVFSKLEHGRFPAYQEVPGLLLD
jgi:selT/selW/selH-like putative selenoprotein